ncbi:hypothetical protein EDC01DRAFT_630556 [Geopyxis carbonaria]|nr:hypothetical protein EDC01DRAFT_630556 [Geopyxis carbonaria]
MATPFSGKTHPCFGLQSPKLKRYPELPHLQTLVFCIYPLDVKIEAVLSQRPSRSYPGPFLFYYQHPKSPQSPETLGWPARYLYRPAAARRRSICDIEAGLYTIDHESPHKSRLDACVDYVDSVTLHGKREINTTRHACMLEFHVSTYWCSGVDNQAHLTAFITLGVRFSEISPRSPSFVSSIPQFNCAPSRLLAFLASTLYFLCLCQIMKPQLHDVCPPNYQPRLAGAPSPGIVPPSYV